jgi:hypothetical protein
MTDSSFSSEPIQRSKYSLCQHARPCLASNKLDRLAVAAFSQRMISGTGHLADMDVIWA